MTNVDVKKQTPIEFREYYKDVLGSSINDIFNTKKDKLVFITYQPKKQTLDHLRVAEHTYKLFNQIKYVEVIEQTFKTSNRYNDGAYIDSYHSHIIAKESDYYNIIGQSKVEGIVIKPVYHLEDLKEYLAKQAGQTNNRILPTKNIPAIIPLPTDTETVKVFQQVFKRLLPPIEIIIKMLHYTYIDCIIRANKIKRLLMYINDT